MADFSSNPELEKGLQALFTEPNPAFVDQLEARLMQAAQPARAAAHPQPAPWFRRPSVTRRAWLAGAAIALLACVVLVAAGPQNVLAAVQKLLGYVPGIGFVENPQQAVRVLAEPVQFSRDGLTLTVEKVLADAKSTLVRVRVDGLPQDKALFEQGWGESSHPLLREEGRPDARTLPSGGSISGAGEFVWAEYSFPTLLSGIQQASLLLDRLPGLKAGAAPENWTIALHLQEVKAGDGVIIATAEPRMSPSIQKAQLLLESLAAMPEQTALKLRLSSDNPQRRADGEWWQGLVLSDDLGQVLPLTREQAFSGQGDGSVVLLAPRLDPSRRYTLRLEQSGFETRYNLALPAPGFRLAVPANAQSGQSWDVNETLEVAGYRLRILQASLQPKTAQGQVLRLTVEPQPGLVGVGFACKNLETCSASGFDLAQPGQPLTTDVYLKQAPGRSVELNLQMLLETLRGPWEVHFQIEGAR